LWQHRAWNRAANLGYFVFGDAPDTMIATGATIIVLSGLCAFNRERIRHREVGARTAGCRPTDCELRLRGFKSCRGL